MPTPSSSTFHFNLARTPPGHSARRRTAGVAVGAAAVLLLPLALSAFSTPPSTTARPEFAAPAPSDARGREAALATSNTAANSHHAPANAPTDALAGVPFVPFHRKRGEYLNAVRLGLWPAERRTIRDPAYANPQGFHVVTAALRTHPVSPHFTLGEFAMRGGALGADGETYVVLARPLLDKLERVLAELAAVGIPASDLRILSAFRAPRYNAGVEGAAPASRHQFGDAADVVVDSDGDGRMDDLNRDGRVGRADLFLVADAIARVERADAALVGGLGLYDAQGPSGPFLHVDVRGRAARWGTALRATAPARRLAAPRWTPAPSHPSDDIPRIERRPGCTAEGEMAVLCATRRDLLRGGR